MDPGRRAAAKRGLPSLQSAYNVEQACRRFSADWRRFNSVLRREMAQRGSTSLGIIRPAAKRLATLSQVLSMARWLCRHAYNGEGSLMALSMLRARTGQMPFYAARFCCFKESPQSSYTKRHHPASVQHLTTAFTCLEQNLKKL